MKTLQSLNDKRFVEKRQSYEIKQLWENHHQILRLISLGMKNTEIASELNISSQTVSNVRNSALAQEVLQKQKETLDEEIVSISKRIEKFTPIALQLLEDIIEGKVETSIGLAARTAENYVSRGGYGTVQKSVSLNGTLTKSDLERIKERAKEAKRENSLVAIEVESREIE